MTNDTFRVYTRWIALELRRQGFKILDTDINEYNPEFKVWIFERTPEFIEAFNEVSRSKRQEELKMSNTTRAIALLSDVSKNNFNEKDLFYQISPLMFQKINEKIGGKCGNQRTLLLYLIYQQQNSDFRPAEATILKACSMDHSQYVRARAALVELGLIEYEPNKYIKILYNNLMA